MRRLGFFFALIANALAAAPVRDFSARAEVMQPTKLWTEPTQYGEAIAALEPGLKVKVTSYSTSGSWAKIQTPGGREGWIPVRFTSLAGRYKKKPQAYVIDENGQRRPASEDSAVALATAHDKVFYASGSLEYANQVSIGKTHGFGLGVIGGYYLTQHFAPGLWISWNRFSETAQDSFNSVKRTAQRYFIGPNGRYEYGHFAVDGSLGADIIKSSFKITDKVNHTTLTTACSGSSTETALGLNIRPSYSFPMGATTLLEVYTAYGIGFHGGGSCVPDEGGSAPQQFSLGVAIHAPL